MAKPGAISTPVVEVLGVLIESDLKCAGSKASVGLCSIIIPPCDCGLVNHSLC